MLACSANSPNAKHNVWTGGLSDRSKEIPLEDQERMTLTSMPATEPHINNLMENSQFLSMVAEGVSAC